MCFVSLCLPFPPQARLTAPCPRMSFKHSLWTLCLLLPVGPQACPARSAPSPAGAAPTGPAASTRGPEHQLVPFKAPHSPGQSGTCSQPLPSAAPPWSPSSKYTDCESLLTPRGRNCCRFFSEISLYPFIRTPPACHSRPRSNNTYLQSLSDSQTLSLGPF